MKTPRETKNVLARVSQFKAPRSSLGKVTRPVSWAVKCSIFRKLAIRMENEECFSS